MRSVSLAVLIALGPVLWPPAAPGSEPSAPQGPRSVSSDAGTGTGGPSRPWVVADSADERGGFRSRGERWVWPLDPRPVVMRGFERPSTTWAPGHRGLDLSGAEGERVLAAASGQVSFAGQVAGRGVLAVVHDDGLRTTYEPVRPLVEVGQTVRVGDPIGLLNPGGHCAPDVCLHWGLIRGSFYLDPSTLFAVRPPRLLPILSG